ncbi:MAG: DUF1844 domain-containing protein [Planctomycetota bacterium]|nr:DUF1844 domain-containing protein [Planctomycetota bacterium]
MSDEQEPKIIIDEDWKSQVEREREELKAREAAEETAAEKGESEASAETTSQPEDAGDMPPMPEASFPFLVTSLASQAVMSLGQMPGPEGQPVPVNLNHAKHFIDTLGILEEKTTGNLDEEEGKFLQETLHQIRMMYVAIQQQQGG